MTGLNKTYSYNLKTEKKVLTKPELFIFALSSMLGIGIFMKSEYLIKLSSFNIWALLALFIFSGILILSLVFSFTTLVSSYSFSGRSFIEWVERYCGLNFCHWAVLFTVKYAHPLGLVIVSNYLVNLISKSSYLWVWERAALSTLFSFLSILLNIFSFRISSFFQKILFFFILLTILFISILGIDSFYNGGASSGLQVASTNDVLPVNNDHLTLISLSNFQKNSQSPILWSGWSGILEWRLILSGLPSIFFMYDGFYSVLALKDRVKNREWFRGVILGALIAITVAYLWVIFVILLGDSNGGSFWNFHRLKSDKNLKDLLMVLMILTFLSSLNSSVIFGYKHIHELHKKYDFKSINFIRNEFLNRGSHKFLSGLERELSIWMNLSWRIIVSQVALSGLVQVSSWLLGSDISLFEEIVEYLSEILSLLIFVILGAVLWSIKSSEKRRLYKFLYLFSSCSIFMGAFYFLMSSLISFMQTWEIKSFVKISALLFFSFCTLKPYLITHQIHSSCLKLKNYQSQNKLSDNYRLVGNIY